MRAAFLRRDEKLDLIGEKNEPDFVVVADRAEGEQAGHFRGELALRLRDAAEVARRADVDDQHHRQLALFREFLHEGGAEPRGHVPVDRANFVARLVFAHVFEIHPAPFEDAVVIARESRLHETLGLDLERAGSFLRISAGVCWLSFTGDYGTGRPAKIRSMIVSLVTALGLGFVADDDAMAQDVRPDALDILRRDVAAAVQEA